MDWGLSRVGLALIGVESRETQQYEISPATSSEVQPGCRDWQRAHSGHKVLLSVTHLQVAVSWSYQEGSCLRSWACSGGPCCPHSL